MTDAREIITCLLKREFGPHADRVAVQDFFRNIEDAGIRLAGPDDRILGKDEVDPVTVEKCAETALCQFDDRGNGRSGHYSEMDWTDGYRDATRAAAAAIRALTEKRHE